MKIAGKPFRTIWLHADGKSVEVIDQTRLPHAFAVRTLRDLDAAVDAIHSMVVRGAPLIGATAAYGLALAMAHDACDAMLANACERLAATRPTAVNLRWALARLSERLYAVQPQQRCALAYQLAASLCDEDVRINAAIGVAGAEVIAGLWDHAGRQRPVNVLTHCNAGWLATVDWGTALAPIYRAHDSGIPVHVFVDETRPRNQGASLTAWELGQHGVLHTLIADNAGGHLMQHGMVDMVITGADRVTRNGDAANKIGTYLKALAARDNGVPMYVALPSSTFDFSLRDGVANIPIEERDASEVRFMVGQTAQGNVESVRICPPTTPARNWGFDVTPARLITQLICERGICAANEDAILSLFPEQR